LVFRCLLQLQIIESTWTPSSYQHLYKSTKFSVILREHRSFPDFGNMSWHLSFQTTSLSPTFWTRAQEPLFLRIEKKHSSVRVQLLHTVQVTCLASVTRNTTTILSDKDKIYSKGSDAPNSAIAIVYIPWRIYMFIHV
jgi:hypothetical protein